MEEGPKPVNHDGVVRGAWDEARLALEVAVHLAVLGDLGLEAENAKALLNPKAKAESERRVEARGECGSEGRGVWGK